MAHPYRDFDAMWSERESQTISIRVVGRDYDISGKLPASVALRIARMRSSGGDNAVMSNVDVSEMAEMVLGKINLDQMLADGIDFDQLGDVLQYIVGVMSGAPTDAVNPQTPAPTVAAG